MPTIDIPGYGRRSFIHPRELLQTHPTGPAQPIASYPDTLRVFTAHVASGDYGKAVGWLRDEHVRVSTTDIDPGSLAAFKAYVRTISQTIHGSSFDCTGYSWWS